MNLADLYLETMSQFALPFVRISGVLMVLPLIGTRLVAARVRLILALLITFAVYPQVSVPPDIEPGTLLWTVVAAKELLIGVMQGLIVQMLFQVLVVAGQVIAMQAGLGFAQLVDPVNGVSVAAISQLYLLMANIFFFSTNGHLAVFQIVAESFQQYPIGMQGFGGLVSGEFFKVMSWMFASGLLLALPVVTALLMVNLTFGVISKLSPQFNVFSFGFAFTVVVGIIMVAITLPRLLPAFEDLTEAALIYMRQING